MLGAIPCLNSMTSWNIMFCSNLDVHDGDFVVFFYDTYVFRSLSIGPQGKRPLAAHGLVSAQYHSSPLVFLRDLSPVLSFPYKAHECVVRPPGLVEEEDDFVDDAEWDAVDGVYLLLRERGREERLVPGNN